jgi:hypothetical protein
LDITGQTIRLSQPTSLTGAIWQLILEWALGHSNIIGSSFIVRYGIESGFSNWEQSGKDDRPHDREREPVRFIYDF